MPRDGHAHAWLSGMDELALTSALPIEHPTFGLQAF